MIYGNIDGLEKKISKIILGNDFQKKYTKASKLWDFYFSKGGNTFDNSIYYRDGLNEKLLGTWIKSRSLEKEIVLISKVGNNDTQPSEIKKLLNISLDRLKIDYIDILILHHDNPSIPIGEFIDSFDVVIRMNKGWKITPDRTKDYGSKTDIRWHCMMEHPDNGGDFAIDDMLDHGVEWLASQFPRNLDYFHYDNIKFEQKNNNKMNFHCFADLIYFLNIHRALETRPNVAPTAIFELINYDIENIHLMGVTFFKDGWDKGYKEGEYKKERALDGHAQEAQIHLLKLILENEPKFTMDKEIETLIYNK